MMLSAVETLTPEQIVALTIWGEARGGTSLLRQGVGSVIQNRVTAQRPGWGETPQKVCLAPDQFSCWLQVGGAANYNALMDLVTNIHIPEFVVGPIYRECLALGWQITGQHLEDVTKGAHYYFAPLAMKPVGRLPSWAKDKTPSVVIDGVEFFA